MPSRIIDIPTSISGVPTYSEVVYKVIEIVVGAFSITFQTAFTSYSISALSSK
jgi:hypothetical protein